MEPLAVDIREAGRLTSLSPHTIRAYVRKGKIRAVRVGRRVLVPIESLQDLLRPTYASDQENERQATPRL